jgi:DNA-binding MarR family transcriptional regulator
MARYEARDVGIPWTALVVLKDLSLLGPSMQKTLADIEQVREPTMSVLLRQMQEQGWIKRARDPRYPRTKLVEITRGGHKALSGAGHVIRQRLREELEGLSARDDQRLEVALRPLAELLMGKIGEAREELSA